MSILDRYIYLYSAYKSKSH